MENTVIQYTFLKFDQSKKIRFSIKTPDKTEKPRSSEKKTAVATLLTIPVTAYHGASFGSNVVGYSNLGSENSAAGHIKCSRGPQLFRGSQVPHPCFTVT